MFVLCPHCHFLVGIDPRTGKPPATCPKCGGLVVEPLPDIPAGSTHAEEIPVAAAAPLAPFAPVELPSVLPTLPEAAPETEASGQEQEQEHVPEPEPEQQTKQAIAEPLIAEPDATPAPIASAVPETAATPGSKPRWWSRRKAEPAKAAAPAAAAIPPPATPAPTASDAPLAMPASQTEREASRADAMIATLQGRRRATRKAAEPPPPPIPPPSAVAAVEVEVEADALPPAVQIEDVVDATAATARIDRPADAPAGAPAGAQVQAPATPAKRTRKASVAIADADSAATTMTTASIESGAAAATPEALAPAGMPVAPHPLRRRTDFDPSAPSEPIAGSVPPHPLRRRTDAPSFTRPRVRASAASHIGWRSLVAVGGLSLLLVLQLLLAQRDTLAASARWRSTIATVCATLRCSLPAWHEPAAFTMLSRDVRPHPGAPGTLLINASFRNDARWPQPWPRLLLTLSDLDGRMVGARSFSAAEYLGAAPTQFELAPGQTAAVTLSVVEPAPNIVAFTFDFR